MSVNNVIDIEIPSIKKEVKPLEYNSQICRSIGIKSEEVFDTWAVKFPVV